MLLLAVLACARLPSPSAAAVPSAARGGVVLVSMDTVRADHTSPGGAPAGSTPNLSRLAAEGIVFDHAYSQANETLFSHGSMFTSQVPSHLASVDYDFTIPDGTATLATEMRAAGYATGAIVAGGHLARIYGLDDGFDTYAEGARFGSFQETIPMALKWVDRQVAAGEPFFLFVHGYDAHSPYTKPGVFARMGSPGYRSELGKNLFNPQFYDLIYRDRVYPDFRLPGKANNKGMMFPDLGFFETFRRYTELPDTRSDPLSAQEKLYLQASYATAVYYADLWVAVLMAELDKRGLLSTTTVAVMSDHGEGLLEYGVMSHRHTLRDAATHVPLVIRPAGGAAPTIVHTPVSLLDLAPTLLELAGARAAPTMAGRSLVPCFDGPCPPGNLPYSENVLREASVTDGQSRLVVQGLLPSAPGLDAALQTGVGAEFLLYDVAQGEQQDVAGDPSRAGDVARLRAAMLLARGGAVLPSLGAP